MNKRKLGLAIVGLGGAVGTTIVAGIELLKKGEISTDGLPLANLPENLIKDLAIYKNLVFGGWDLHAANLASAAEEHDVLTHKQFVAVEAELRKIKPWRAASNKEFLVRVKGENVFSDNSHRSIIEKIKQDLRDFRAREKCDEVVVVNLGSTEKLADEGNEIFNSIAGFEKALDEDSKEISPAMLYAYAAISEQIPYGNFTPSVAADIPALVEFAEKQKVPVAGKDGKTGQTMIKTALAPALKTRALKVEGWYSTNILGNRDGLALSHEDSLRSKIKTKGSVLDDILGYTVEDHIVDIRYYRPRGDNKEAWDNIDVTGFLGQPMQIKINFLCRDSILAAPLAIEIARLLDLAKRRNSFGVQEQLSVFFKLPMSKNSKPEHALYRQEEMLLNWLSKNE
ncbi:MAG: inositol-3-phosphate synthase [Acidobacteriota bacterium]|nr:inositol-3-phosphate synthase [Acidobacteriota bacterium]